MTRDEQVALVKYLEAKRRDDLRMTMEETAAAHKAAQYLRSFHPEVSRDNFDTLLTRAGHRLAVVQAALVADPGVRHGKP